MRPKRKGGRLHAGRGEMTGGRASLTSSFTHEGLIITRLTKFNVRNWTVETSTDRQTAPPLSCPSQMTKRCCSCSSSRRDCCQHQSTNCAINATLAASFITSVSIHTNTSIAIPSPRLAVRP
eukprot:6205187-Pleurochrysis_carterae.AAC.2